METLPAWPGRWCPCFRSRLRAWAAAVFAAWLLAAGTLAGAATIQTFAGNLIPSGQATNVGIGANGVAVDVSGRVYVADASNHTVRRIDPATGLSVVVAGTGASGFSGDGGPATSAQLNSPKGVALDGTGNLYIADTSNHRIRKVDTGGTITTIAGTGTASFGGDNAAATAARVNAPQGVAVDADGKVYIADTSNHRVRRIDTGGTITTVAGNGTAGYLADNVAATGTRINAPRGVALDAAGNFYIADTSNNRIRKVDAGGTITTFAGTGAASFSGDNGAATSATLRAPQALAFDGAGDLYIADTTNHRVRKISGNTITTIAGTGSAGYGGDGGANTAGRLSSPSGIAVDAAGRVYIGDTGNLRVRRIAGGEITTFAGTGSATYGGDGGLPLDAQFTSPQLAAFDGAGNIYLPDSGTHRIRKVAPDGTITTVAGIGVAGYSGDGGPATDARLNTPLGIALDAAGNLYFADGNNNRIRKVDTGGTITTIAGDGTGSYGGDNGPATSAQLFGPFAVAVDGQGNVFITDTGNNRVRRVDAGGTITTVAGDGTASYDGDNGAATSARFNTPIGIAIDAAGRIYISDYGNGAVRRFTPGGTITTVAGNGANGYGGDGGPATSAQLNSPRSVAVDAAGTLYIADTANNRIRQVDTGGTITTLAGDGNAAFSGDGGPPGSAQLSTPQGVTVVGTAGLMVADTGNRRFRFIALGATPPGAPTAVTAVGGSASATVGFAPPVSDGGLPVRGYTVTSDPPGGVDSQAGQPSLSRQLTGLTDGVAYTFSVRASNLVGMGPAAQSGSVTPGRVDGACGAAAGVATVFKPAADLCAAGSAGSVSDAAPWAWSCGGVHGGAPASCSAPAGPTGTGSGSTSIAIGAGGGWTVDLAGNSNGLPHTAGAIGLSGHAKSPAEPPPAGYAFPHGLMDFTLVAGAGPATVTISYPTPLPPGTVYWKYGRTAPADAPHWYRFPGAVVSGDRLSITLTLSDGALGDSDALADGVITDPGGPGVPLSAAAQPIPTLSSWALALTSLLLAAAVPAAQRRGRKTRTTTKPGRTR